MFSEHELEVVLQLLLLPRHTGTSRSSLASSSHLTDQRRFRLKKDIAGMNQTSFGHMFRTHSHHVDNLQLTILEVEAILRFDIQRIRTRTLLKITAWYHCASSQCAILLIHPLPLVRTLVRPSGIRPNAGL